MLVDLFRIGIPIIIVIKIHLSKRTVKAIELIIAEIISDVCRDRSSGLSEFLSEKEETACAPVLAYTFIAAVSPVHLESV